MAFAYVPPLKKTIGDVVSAPKRFTLWQRRRYFEGDDVERKYPLWHTFHYECETTGVTESFVEYRIVKCLGEWFRPQNVPWQVDDKAADGSLGMYVHWTQETWLRDRTIEVQEWGDDFVVASNPI